MTNYAIIYIGAPYAPTESGHIVSKHKSVLLAIKAYRKSFSGNTGVYNNIICALKEDNSYDRTKPVTWTSYGNETMVIDDGL